jgi:nuclear GTP-binding protein
MKYKINRKVREHHRKVRKEARKAKKLGLPVKSNKKTTRIPNSFPHKKELMEQQEIMINQEKEKNKKDKKKEEDPVIMEDNTNSQVITEAPEVIKKCNFKFELNSLIEVCDVIIEVLDARDPLSYRSRELENNLKTKGKKLIILLNKIDLVTKYIILK